MNAKKLELIALASVMLFSIAAVGAATASRTGAVDADLQANVPATTTLISSAQASPLEHVDAKGAQVARSEERAPIYLDLGAKF
jgi:hypothetical protein